jgi:ketosteroid isomerase-like protein
MRSTAAVLIASLALAACAHQAPSTADLEVHRFVTTFIQAVNEADIDDFVACFAEDATAFFPSASNAMVRTGTAQIRAAVAPTFQRGPPERTVEPRDLSITINGDAALVTFIAGSTTQIARRTLVLKRASGTWKIAHLHASNVNL